MAEVPLPELFHNPGAKDTSSLEVFTKERLSDRLRLRPFHSIRGHTLEWNRSNPNNLPVKMASSASSIAVKLEVPLSLT
ncbi:MAG: hypothetical protein A2428_08545 [Bdellovibrionales bacterium RIFOXYC1_FULL_54_43]|nr:MAG: hypothetical protein A2428_08545 [Bdellovibrionales bacterium RIFOXYC1_FULL_54_43]